MKIHHPERFRKKLRKYERLDNRLSHNKPFLQAVAGTDGGEVPVILLIDDGMGDGRWLFEDSRIHAPKRSFHDILGLGLLGDVTGKRSRKNTLRFGKYFLKSPTVAFP